MRSKRKAPFGSWSSPITPDLMLSGSVGLGEISYFGDSIYWIEMRPEERGRYVIVELKTDGTRHEMIPSEFNARSRVHEYGGGSYLVTSFGLFFTNFIDQSIYQISNDGECKKLTHNDMCRYADFVFDERQNRLICVREDHSDEAIEPINTIIAISITDGSEKVLVEGADFFSNPRLSPEGKQLCWIEWCHPNMPWDNTSLYIADINETGDLERVSLVSGTENESVCQPVWSSSCELYFISDKTGWWNIYRYRNNETECIYKMQAEFAVPQWSFRETSYCFVNDNKILSIYWQEGLAHLCLIDIENKQLHDISLPFTDLESVACNNDTAWFLAASPNEFPAVIKLNINNHSYKVIRKSNDITIDPAYISEGKPITFPVNDDETAHAFFYLPINKEFIGRDDEKPPLIVISHGGPTGASHNGLKMVVQFFTSRGFAVVDVNYSGSTGYGRAYRQRLNGQWGIADVNDCSKAALYVADLGWVDKDRLAIRGGSAGGFTTLAALAFTNVFKAGASHYGVSDLEALAKETHKFESRYLDSLIGPYPGKKNIYEQRSPINAVDKLSCPVIFFQGLEDKIVLPNQAEMMVHALKQKGIPVVYITYEGEQHGFRQSKNIKRTLEAELYFYSKIFNFECADKIEPIEFL